MTLKPFAARLTANSGSGKPPYTYIANGLPQPIRAAVAKATDEAFPNGLAVVIVPPGLARRVMANALAFYASTGCDDREAVAIWAMDEGVSPAAYQKMVAELLRVAGGA